MDHNVPTEPGPIRDLIAKAQLDALAANCEAFGVPLNATGSGREGIVHVMGPELGLTQPGMTIVCGDSHTSTHGAFGGARVRDRHLGGRARAGDADAAAGAAEDDADHLHGRPAASASPRRTWCSARSGRSASPGGVGYVLEYAGPAIEALSMEGRMTVCNMSIEGGARAGMVGPDDTTFAYLEGRPGAPKGADWERALDEWRALRTDAGAVFDREVEVDVAALVPQVTWGTNPGMVAPIDGRVPDPAAVRRSRRPRGGRARAALHGSRAREPPLADIAVDRVFIGSCTNSRIEDLRAAAEVVNGHRVASTRARDGRPRLGADQAPGRGRGPRPRLHRRRLRVARGGLLDVPRHEPGHPLAGRALRLDLEPQLRGPPGRRRPHAPSQPDDGRRGGDHRPPHRRPGARH